MKTKTHIALAILLLPYVLSLSGIFFGLFLTSHQNTFQQRVKETESKSTVLVFTNEEFQNIQWTEQDIEFEKDGKMYDVANIVHKDNTVEIYCENDSLEEMMRSYLGQFGHGERSNLTPYIQFYQPIEIYACACTIYRDAITTDTHPVFYISTTPDLSTPPPRSIS
ncbi:MAG: hypothetical protein JST43_12460 [Bacteroidetes bacterium]|nr:hypothetical protein [Bacteroidota bacterium]MBS1541692.1 hypothetical protein [Bacteroidota bacterium]